MVRGFCPRDSDKDFPLLHYGSVIKASDPLQSKEGIELGLSDPWVCTSSAPHAFKGASKEIFQMSSDAVGLYDFGHSGT